jgi:hypothetical protein
MIGAYVFNIGIIFWWPAWGIEYSTGILMKIFSLVVGQLYEYGSLTSCNYPVKRSLPLWLGFSPHNPCAATFERHKVNSQNLLWSACKKATESDYLEGYVSLLDICTISGISAAGCGGLFYSTVTQLLSSKMLAPAKIEFAILFLCSCPV